MHNSFLLNYFKYLDKKDRRELRKAVRSPFFNQKEEIIRLFDCLDKHIDSPKVPLSQAWVFEQVFPDKPFNALLLHHAASALTQLTRRFLAISAFENTPPQYQLSLTRALRQRQATKMYEHELKEAKTFLDKQPLRNAEFHLQHYMLLLDEYDYKRQHRREGDLPVQELSDNLDNFYLAETLRQACTMKAHQNVAQQLNYRQPLSEAVLMHLDLGKIENTPTIAAFFYALKAQNEQISEQNDENTEGSYFEKLKDLLINHRHYFNHEELKNLYILAINYCIKQQNRGKITFIQEALDLYEVGLNNEILLENGSISQYAYRNVALLAMKVGDWKKAEDMLRKYKKYLPSIDRENFYKYNSAFLSFRQGNADKAMELLQETQLREPLYNLDARRLLARIYFEKKEKDALESLTIASRTYISRQKNIGYQKDMYENFFVFIAKIMKLDKHSKAKKEALKAEIISTEWVAEKAWLLEILA
jgi:hypothetical protein